MRPLDVLEQIVWRTDQATLQEWLGNAFSFDFTGVGAEAPQSTHHVKQVHGTKIVATSDVTAGDAIKRVEADGVFTGEDGEIVGVKTADCLPLLFFHEKGVMAVHAGWRGLASGIVSTALETYARLGANSSKLKVILGPCISLGSFEVGPEVMAALRDGPNPLHGEWLAWCASKGRDDRWHLDLQKTAAFIMQQRGVRPEHIAVVRQCTFLHPQLWHSFRRDREHAGRNWSWARLNGS